MGARYLVAGNMSLSDVLIVVMTIMLGAFSIGNVVPNIQTFTTALSAAVKIFSTIDRVSPIDPGATKGLTLDHFDGVLELRNIKHIYPSRPDVIVMEDFNAVFPPGTTALVGASGSGKSTVVHLIEMFYRPVRGQILLDGHEISTLNLRWLRQQISLVSQETTLFSTTIYENIRRGLGTKFDQDTEGKQRERVIDAAKLANAHEFITSLSDGYETYVGEHGAQLSGGQKQRIAVARAIISDPKILLLDEATSALDTKSEEAVQAALDAASKGRTTISIAHRLSTIKTADNIIVMAEGRVVEQGKHDNLLGLKGAYYQLGKAQRIVDFVDGNENTAREAHLNNPVHFQSLMHEASIGDGTGREKHKSSIDLGHGKSEKKQHSLWALVRLVGSYNREELQIMIFGVLCSIVCGCGNPTQSVLLAEQITTLSLPPKLYSKLIHDADFYSVMYVVLAVVQFISFGCQGIGLAYCSEKLIRRVRDTTFRTMLHQDIAFFDRKENSAGALTSFLSTETTYLAGISGTTLSTLILVTTTLIVAVTVACSFAWKLGLVCTAVMPVMVSCGFFRFWILAQFQIRAKTSYQASASYACEAVSAMRTVASLTREDDVWNDYHDALVEQSRRNLIFTLKSSLLYAASQSFVTLCIGLSFWYVGTLIGNREYSNLQFFIAFSATTYGAQAAGAMFSFAPDMGKAKQAAQELKTLFDREPEIELLSDGGEPLDDVQGAVEFRDVYFNYPSKPQQPVLHGLSFTVKPGQFVALVGASGCGKSTAIALLERFYDPFNGGVYVDGKNISTLNVNQYRKQIALVSQEPTLYQGTIRENVLLGVDEDEMPEEEILRVCKEANIHDFIMSLP